MERKPPSRYLLKRVQIIHSRPYIVPESRSSLPLYPFEQQPEDQVRAPVSSSLLTCVPMRSIAVAVRRAWRRFLFQHTQEHALSRLIRHL